MRVEGKIITIEKTLWMQYGGVGVSAKKGSLVLDGQEEDAFLKVFNHFGRVLKLFVFENGIWVDSDTGEPVVAVDLSQAGRVEGSLPAAAPPKGGPPKSKAQPGTKASGSKAPKSKAKAKPKASMTKAAGSNGKPKVGAAKSKKSKGA